MTILVLFFFFAGKTLLINRLKELSSLVYFNGL